MATRTIAAGGGNWGTAATWVEVAVPTAADDVVATALSGNLTIDGTSGSPSLCRSADFTGYLGTLTQASSKVLTVGDGTTGNFKLVGTMTYVPNTGSTLNFVSTTTGNNITTAGISMGPVVFNGSGGAWTITDAYTSLRDVTMTVGTVTLNSTISTRAIILNGGTMNLGGSGTFTSGITIAGGTLSGASYTVSGTSVTASSGSMTLAGWSGTGSFAATGATVTTGASGLTCSSGTLTAGTMTLSGTYTTTAGGIGISGTGSLSAAGQNLSLATSFSMSSSGTVSVAAITGTTTLSITAGTTTITGNVSGTTLTMSGSTTRVINLGNGTYTLSGTGAVLSLGSTPTNITLNAQGSTLDFTDTSATTKSPTFGGQTFNKIRVRGAAACGTFTINQSNTFGQITLDQDSNVRLVAGTTQTLTAVPVMTGASGHTIALVSSVAASPATISMASGTLGANWLVLQDIATAGGGCFYAGANSTNTSGNTGWIFATVPPSGQQFAANGSF